MLARGFASVLLVALALSIIPGSLAGRFNYACVKRCMDKGPDDGWQPVCVWDVPSAATATMVPNLCVWRNCARDYHRGTRWYDRLPVDCTSRVGCSMLYQSDMRCLAAWQRAANGTTRAKPENNDDCTCPRQLPRNKRWFGGSFEPACGKPQANTDFNGGDIPDGAGGHLVETGVRSMAACCDACKGVAACYAYTWDSKRSRCYLKEKFGWTRQTKSGLQSARLVDPDA